MADKMEIHWATNQAGLLHVEQQPGLKMNFKLEGDPMMVCNMIATAMNQDQPIAATIIAAAMLWADRNDIPRDQLGNMVQFHH